MEIVSLLEFVGVYVGLMSATIGKTGDISKNNTAKILRWGLLLGLSAFNIHRGDKTKRIVIIGIYIYIADRYCSNLIMNHPLIYWK